MKRTLAIALLSVITTGFAVADPITDAVNHARLDSIVYTTKGWGALAFGASVLVSPLLGGGAVIIVANVIEPNVDIPTSRFAEAHDAYETGGDILVYQAQYQESMAGPIQKARSRQAWIGTGIGFGVRLIAVAVLLGGLGGISRP